MFQEIIPSIFVKYPFQCGLLIRFSLMILLPLLLDDGYLLSGVKYTDLDYDVYTDAASLMYDSGGEKSPFDRHTYRYTPFLATILTIPYYILGPSQHEFGKRWFGRSVFCFSDAICGYLIMVMRKESRFRHCHREEKKEKTQSDFMFIDALWWLYNPLAINICTRGSSESFIVLLPVLLTLMVTTSSRFDPWNKSTGVVFKSIIGGFIHGISIHSKLYPIIYTPSYMAYLSRQYGGPYWSNDEKESDQKTLLVRKKNNGSTTTTYYGLLIDAINFIYLWMRRILLPPSILFLFISITVFSGITYAGYLIYGKEALEEGLLYHFSRLDHRHNYSIYWYPIYLVRAREEGLSISTTTETTAFSLMTILSKGLFLPQILLLLLTSIKFSPTDLPFGVFLQTFIFVVFNKVITGQYFTWYLCILPLCSDRIRWSDDRGESKNRKKEEMKFAFLGLGLSILFWLGSAFLLEMKGLSVHLMVWSGSIAVFCASVNLLRVILSRYEGYPRNDEKENKDTKEKVS